MFCIPVRGLLHLQHVACQRLQCSKKSATDPHSEFRVRTCFALFAQSLQHDTELDVGLTLLAHGPPGVLQFEASDCLVFHMQVW